MENRMKLATPLLGVLLLTAFLPNTYAACQPPERDSEIVTITTSKVSMTLDFSKLRDTGYKASIIKLTITGKEVLDAGDGMYTSVKVNGKIYSSMHLKTRPVKTQTA